MIPLIVFCEGQGEKLFVEGVLGPHLQRFGIAPNATFFGHKRASGPSGGIRQWGGRRGAAVELRMAIQQGSSSYPLIVTTMVDFYGLREDWPQLADARALPPRERSGRVERGMYDDLAAQLGDDPRIERFVPYVCLHEFEAMILAKPEALLLAFPDCDERAVNALLSDIGNTPPEEVNFERETSPSHRIARHFEGYGRHKGLSAINTLHGIPLTESRAVCPHFDQWLTRLEHLGSGP